MAEKVGHFDICKEMCARNMDIRLSPLDNVVNLQKVKAGTNVTIGVAGDVVSEIGVENKFVGGLLLCDAKQYKQVKEILEAAAHPEEKK